MEAKKGSNNNMYFSIQIDMKLKNDFEYFCETCGMRISDAVTQLAKRTVELGRIPFVVKPVDLYAKALDETGKNYKPCRLTIRMDRGLQDQFAQVCDNIGLTRSIITRMFFMRCLNDNTFVLDDPKGSVKRQARA